MPLSTLSGNVLGQDVRPLWVRVVGLFIPASVESKVDSSGHYAFTGLAPGKYILCVTNGGKLVHSQAIDVAFANAPLDVSLPQPKKIRVGVTELVGRNSKPR